MREKLSLISYADFMAKARELHTGPSAKEHVKNSLTHHRDGSSFWEETHQGRWLGGPASHGTPDGPEIAGMVVKMAELRSGWKWEEIHGFSARDECWPQRASCAWRAILDRSA